MSLKISSIKKGISYILGAIFLILGLMVLSEKAFSIFQYIVQLACIILAFSIWIITKNTHKVSQNNYFLFLGITIILTAVFDFMYFLTYNGAYIIDINASGLASEFRMASRYIQASSLIIFCVLLSRQDKPVKIRKILDIYYVAVIVILCSIISEGIVPNKYNLYRSSIALRNINEVVICFFLLFSLFLILNIKKKIYEDICMLLFLSIISLLISEICFFFYRGGSHLLITFSYILKLMGYYLIYRAIIHTALENPYNILFYKLTEINGSLEIKTRLLMQINKKLNDEIEDRKEIEEKLRISKKNYQELLDFLPYAVLVHSKGKIVYINNSAMELLKAKEYKELLDRSILDIIHPDFHARIIERMNEVYDNNYSELEELQCISLDKKTIDVEMKSVPYVFKDKVSSLVVIRDISERKAAEQKEKALKEAMEYDRIKNEFMANISHELRTPLNVIFSSAQIIEMYSGNNVNGQNSKQITRYSKSLKQNCYRMLRLVNNLIDLTKIDSGFLKLKLTNNNIVSVVEDITLSVAEYIQSKNINVEFDTDVEEKYMACDVDMMERIILNLLSNSVKFTPPKGNIWVNLQDKGDCIIISVKDSGIGIPKDKLEFIFDRFRQVDKSLTRNTEGSGIGLNLVKSLVNLHGGDIHVESTEGEGSEFIIKLPVMLVASDEVAAASEAVNGNVERINIEFSDIYY